MTANLRVVQPELLDELMPNDPRARRSRRDLRRVHRAMGSLTILKRSIEQLRLAEPPRRILELGAGDGSLLLRLARALTPSWPAVSLTLIDRHDLVSQETRKGYADLGWDLTVLRQDVLAWAADKTPSHYDLCIACLFLHHFDAATLTRVMRAIANNADAFVACEPRRNVLARVGSQAIGLLGTNAVTRGDAVKSVDAGFTARELTMLWPDADEAWDCAEHVSLPFTHTFTAVRRSVRRGLRSRAR